MKDYIRQRLNEELTKADVDKKIDAKFDSRDFESKIEKIVKEKLKGNKELEDKVVDITKNVLTQLYKALWTKRSFWSSTLKNSRA